MFQNASLRLASDGILPDVLIFGNCTGAGRKHLRMRGFSMIHEGTSWLQSLQSKKRSLQPQAIGLFDYMRKMRFLSLEGSRGFTCQGGKPECSRQASSYLVGFGTRFLRAFAKLQP